MMQQRKTIFFLKRILSKNLSSLLWHMYIFLEEITCQTKFSFISFIPCFINKISGNPFRRLTKRRYIIGMGNIKGKNTRICF